MSMATTSRIMDETDARLRAARNDDEVRRIGIDHVTALGADLANTAYLKLVSRPELTVDQQAGFLQDTIADLMANIEDLFARQGMTDVTLLAEHLEGAETGFVGRLDELFFVVRIGGQA
ncbi:hypothetical protein [Methylobacterium sp. J-077]|uniref:hypothetical protein n=1 Tax=Methylobacterium sp. J-077 TaxID=2836656 RepID=UPI001FBA95C5|nr:hypothetical protein [Methylobacterium sp. J-077]MCJ2126674.1 hypothetical protein [Methylobacterium sp. J-077]